MGNQRTFLLIALALIIMLMWQAWQKDYGPKPGQAVPQQALPQSPAMAGKDELPQLSENSSLSRQQPVIQSGTDQQKREHPRVHVMTDKLEVWLDTKGGEISHLALRAHPVSLDKPDEPFVLMDDKSSSYYVAQSGLLSRQPAPDHLASYQVGKTRYQMAEGSQELRVPMQWKHPEGVTVTKTFIFKRGTHLIDIAYQIANDGSQNWRGSQYQQLVRVSAKSVSGITSMMIYAFNGAAYYSEEDKFEKLDFDDFRSNKLEKDVKGGWIGMIQHYFLSAWIPDQQETNNFYTRALKKNRFAIGMISPEIIVEAGTTGTFTGRLYSGPKEQRVLDELAEGLSLSVDYSWLTAIAKPIFWLMIFIHENIVDNWGWVIILLTLTIKLLFYKLSEYGYRSMANMRRVQPRLISIKERYGKDKRRMQQAMMELYRKEKINPMSGCFPILLQIPVFIALYWVLLESVELRHAPFMLWIKDLSVQDPYFVLPVIMGITMYIQQKLNPAPMDETQQMIMRFLPFVFTIFFLFFPAGLVLYWVVNNVLSIAQQWVITRRIERGEGKR